MSETIVIGDSSTNTNTFTFNYGSNISIGKINNDRSYILYTWPYDIRYYLPGQTCKNHTMNIYEILYHTTIARSKLEIISYPDCFIPLALGSQICYVLTDSLKNIDILVGISNDMDTTIYYDDIELHDHNPRYDHIKNTNNTITYLEHPVLLFLSDRSHITRTIGEAKYIGVMLQVQHMKELIAKYLDKETIVGPYKYYKNILYKLL